MHLDVRCRPALTPALSRRERGPECLPRNIRQPQPGRRPCPVAGSSYFRYTIPMATTLSIQGVCCPLRRIASLRPDCRGGGRGRAMWPESVLPFWQSNDKGLIWMVLRANPTPGGVWPATCAGGGRGGASGLGPPGEPLAASLRPFRVAGAGATVLRVKGRMPRNRFTLL